MNRMLLQFSYVAIPSSSDVPKNLKCVTAIETPDAFCKRHLNSILLEPPDRSRQCCRLAHRVVTSQQMQLED